MTETVTPTEAARLTGRRLAGAAMTWLAVVVVTFVLGVIGAVIAVIARSIDVGVGVRTILVLLGLATTLVSGYRISRGGPRWLWLLVGALAYVAYPGAWNGKALLATVFGLTGIVAWLVDAVVWMIVVTIVVFTRESMSDERIDVSRLR